MSQRRPILSHTTREPVVINARARPVIKLDRKFWLSKIRILAPLSKTRAWVKIFFDFSAGLAKLLTLGGLTSFIGSISSRGETVVET